MFDRIGHINTSRDDLDEMKQQFATTRQYSTLAEAMVGADVFLGLSVGNIVSKDMVRSMAADPIVFAMANPDSEISYPDAIDARPDIIMATGRSDYPNPVSYTHLDVYKRQIRRHEQRHQISHGRGNRFIECR